VFVLNDSEQHQLSAQVNLYSKFFFSSRRRHTRCLSDWSSDVCSSDLNGGSGGSRHATSIFFAMRLATLVIIGILSSCRRAPRDAYVPNRSDSAAFSDMAAHDSADNALLTPRVVTGPTVIVFWLPAADTLSADDQAEALDDLNTATDHIAPTLK